MFHGHVFQLRLNYENFQYIFFINVIFVDKIVLVPYISYFSKTDISNEVIIYIIHLISYDFLFPGILKSDP